MTIDFGHLIGFILGSIVVSGLAGLLGAFSAMRVHMAVDAQAKSDLERRMTGIDDRINRHAEKLDGVQSHEQRIQRIERHLNGALK